MTEQPNDPVPPRTVLDAFRVTGTPVRLAGGQGLSVRVGGYVFKPAEGTEAEVSWAASLFETVASGRGFRVPRPLRTADGRCLVDGWTAHEFLAGEPGPRGRWSEVLSAGRAFHAALRDCPRPGFLGSHTHPWAVADRVAWGEQDVEVAAGLAAPFSALLELRRPVRQDTAQLVHGDLTGNVLFAPGRAPVVIDFSPYWRPPLFAEAVVVADGLLWFGLTSGRPPAVSDHRDWQQMLIRALIFRLVAESENAGPDAPARPGEAERYTGAIESVVRELGAGRG
ncbi:aminoglycoside phosphotransferase [Streptomyces sp. NBC_00102]|uniref:aminoglycoside phosphotransferase n=1 Tax=Streptomyces sp. NBC_00102 TaxID=2975652 RepID=UPI00225523A6|nr:aminoglycoside phosphotransferase [Streptomyces sp. NBC_00102]MCX5397587.1 aminoglycoside phosphotransferase [Streptomyces sp. NBC_00102]